MKKLIDCLERAFNADAESYLIAIRLLCGFVVGCQAAMLLGFDLAPTLCAGLLAADVIQRRL